MVYVGYAVWPLRPHYLVQMVDPLRGWLCVFGDRAVVRRGLRLRDVRVPVLTRASAGSDSEPRRRVVGAQASEEVRTGASGLLSNSLSVCQARQHEFTAGGISALQVYLSKLAHQCLVPVQWTNGSLIPRPSTEALPPPARRVLLSQHPDSSSARYPHAACSVADATRPCMPNGHSHNRAASVLTLPQLAAGLPQA